MSPQFSDTSLYYRLGVATAIVSAWIIRSLLFFERGTTSVVIIVGRSSKKVAFVATLALTTFGALVTDAPSMEVNPMQPPSGASRKLLVVATATSAGHLGFGLNISICLNDPQEPALSSGFRN